MLRNYFANTRQKPKEYDARKFLKKLIAKIRKLKLRVRKRDFDDKKRSLMLLYTLKAQQ